MQERCNFSQWPGSLKRVCIKRHRLFASGSRCPDAAGLLLAVWFLVLLPRPFPACTYEVPVTLSEVLV